MQRGRRGAKGEIRGGESTRWAAHLLAGHRASFGIMLLHLDTSLCSLQATIIDNSDISKN
jgi:hypothetical protein